MWTAQRELIDEKNPISNVQDHPALEFQYIKSFILVKLKAYLMQRRQS